MSQPATDREHPSGGFQHPANSTGVNIEAGLLLHAGAVLVDHQRRGEPTLTDGYSEVGSFAEQVWGEPRERGHKGAEAMQSLQRFIVRSPDRAEAVHVA